MGDYAEKLYSILKADGKKSYDTEWIKKNTGMSPDEINKAADILEGRGRIKLHKFIGGNYPYNFSVIEVLEN